MTLRRGRLPSSGEPFRLRTSIAPRDTLTVISFFYKGMDIMIRKGIALLAVILSLSAGYALAQFTQGASTTVAQATKAINDLKAANPGISAATLAQMAKTADIPPGVMTTALLESGFTATDTLQAVLRNDAYGTSTAVVDAVTVAAAAAGVPATLVISVTNDVLAAQSTTLSTAQTQAINTASAGSGGGSCQPAGSASNSVNNLCT